QLLADVDHAEVEPLARVGDLGQLAFEVDLAFDRLGRAVDDAREGRLAGAVLARQRVDLARADREIDAIERDHTGVHDGRAAYLYKRRLYRRIRHRVTYSVHFPVPFSNCPFSQRG